MTPRITLLALLLVVPALAYPGPPVPQPLNHLGHTVVFFGDSNTAWGTWPKLLKLYVRDHVPNPPEQWINLGESGDDTWVARARIDDVKALRPSTVVVMFGVNDLLSCDYQVRSTQRDLVRNLVVVCRNLRAGLPWERPEVWLLTYPVLEPSSPGSSYTFFDPNCPDFQPWQLTASSDSLLQRLGDEAIRQSQPYGVHGIDAESVLRAELTTLRSVNPQPAGFQYLHQPSGIHLNERGNELLAAEILSAWGAPWDDVQGELAGIAAANNLSPIPED